MISVRGSRQHANVNASVSPVSITGDDQRDMRVAEVRQFCELDDAGQQLVKAAMTQLQLSARAYHRILKLARTVVDLAGEESIQSAHLAEALQYRPKGMMV